MKILSTLALLAALSVGASAQTTITNGGFENWGNTVPAGDTCTEPTNWYSDLSGSSNAQLGEETCFKSTTAHSGTYSVKVVTIKDLILGGLITEYINGVVTTGVVNAPTTTKTDGYIGTINYSKATDIRRMAFTGQPDSLVGWYQYTPSSTSPLTERGKIRAILHVGNYFDPETPTTYHPACIDSQVASAIFLTDTPGTTVSSWTRFSVPFIYTTGYYASGMAPQYIMINVTPSANQNTNVAGSTLLLDDLQVVYNLATCTTVSGLTASAITSTSATISWTAATGTVVGYVYTVTTSATAPADGSGTFTASTSANITGLTASTSYYAWVYDSCAVGSASGWVSYPFVTNSASGCAAVTGLTASSVTSNSATISWTAATGTVAGYVYTVTPSATLPADGSGTFTTATTASITGLTSGTTYYAYVYDSCGASSSSAWATSSFTTANTGISNITAGSFSITAFPNPVKDELTISITGSNGKTGSVQLLDISGRVINTTIANASTLNMSMNGLPAGVYIIRYIDAEHTQTIKINKQ